MNFRTFSTDCVCVCDGGCLHVSIILQFSMLAVASLAKWEIRGRITWDCFETMSGIAFFVNGAEDLVDCLVMVYTHMYSGVVFRTARKSESDFDWSTANQAESLRKPPPTSSLQCIRMREEVSDTSGLQLNWGDGSCTQIKAVG